MKKRKLILMALMLLGIGATWGQTTTPHVAIGDILCDDGSTVRREQWSSTSGETPIGIVFYVEFREGGWHGSAIALNEAHGLRWADANYDNTILGNTATTVVKEAVSDWNGAANTQYIVEIIGANLTEANYPALWYVKHYREEHTGENWYLPAMGQLHYLYGYIDEINATAAVLNAASSNTATHFAAGEDFPNGNWSYWPSTEYKQAYKIWFLNYNGDCASDANDAARTATPAQKAELKRVRAAIDF